MRSSRAPPARRKHRTMDNITRLLLLSLCGLCASSPLGRLLQRRRDAFEVYAREFTRDYEPYMFAAIPLHAPVPVLRVLSRAPLQPPRARDAQPASSVRHSAYARPYEPAPAYYSPVQHYEVGAPQYLEPARAAHYRDPTRQYLEPTGAATYREPTRHYSEATPGAGAAHYREPTRQYLKPPRQYAAAAAEPEYEASSYDYSRDYARPVYYQKPRRQPAYEYAAEYDSYLPQPQLIRPSPLPQLTYAVAPTAYDSVSYSATQEAAPTVLYARPSPSGGFTYRRVPEATAPAASAAAETKKVPPQPAPLKEKEKDPPFILKIHKYRIVKDDFI